MRWIKRWRFAYGLRKAAPAALASGEIDQKQHDRLIAASRDKHVLNRTLDQIEVAPDLYGEIDWVAIYEWIMENIVPLLKVIIPLVIMVLDDDE